MPSPISNSRHVLAQVHCFMPNVIKRDLRRADKARCFMHILLSPCSATLCNQTHMQPCYRFCTTRNVQWTSCYRRAQWCFSTRLSGNKGTASQISRLAIELAEMESDEV